MYRCHHYQKFQVLPRLLAPHNNRICIKLQRKSMLILCSAGAQEVVKLRAIVVSLWRQNIALRIKWSCLQDYMANIRMHTIERNAQPECTYKGLCARQAILTIMHTKENYLQDYSCSCTKAINYTKKLRRVLCIQFYNLPKRV